MTLINYLELNSFKDQSQISWDLQMHFNLPTNQGQGLTKIIYRNILEFWCYNFRELLFWEKCISVKKTSATVCMSTENSGVAKKKPCEGWTAWVVKIHRKNIVLKRLNLGNIHWSIQSSAVNCREQRKSQQNNITPWIVIVKALIILHAFCWLNG